MSGGNVYYSPQNYLLVVVFLVAVLYSTLVKLYNIMKRTTRPEDGVELAGGYWVDQRVEHYHSKNYTLHVWRQRRRGTNRV